MDWHCLKLKKKKGFLVHKIKFGERKTPHVEGLLFAIKISNRWVFERKRKNKDKRFGDCFEIYRIKEKKKER